MLYSTKTPAEKRAGLRERLATGELLRFPGSFTPLSTKLIQEKGFEGVYISGAVLSNELGMPDIGLTTLTVIADAVHGIRERTGSAPDLDSLPLDDVETYRMLRAGKTAGVFQFESPLATDMLKSIPGFSVIRKGGTDGDPVFRGMSGSRLGILLDGQEIHGGCGGRMDPPTAYIYPESYDRVTVLNLGKELAAGTPAEVRSHKEVVSAYLGG